MKTWYATKQIQILCRILVKQGFKRAWKQRECCEYFKDDDFLDLQVLLQ